MLQTDRMYYVKPATSNYTVSADGGFNYICKIMKWSKKHIYHQNVGE